MKGQRDSRRLTMLGRIGSLVILLALAGCHSHPRSGKESGGAAPAPRPPDAAMSGVSSAPLALSANLPVQKPASAGKAAPPLSPQGRALLKRGVAAYEADDPATAIKAFEQMIQSDPQAPIARAYLGLLYVRQKRYADALKQFQEERKRLPNPAVAWAHIADVYYAQGDLPAAIRSLEKAAELQPDLAQVYFNLGMLYPQTLDLNKGIWAL